MDAEISEEELDFFLKETGILANGSSEKVDKKEESLDKLLEEMIGSIQREPSCSTPDAKTYLTIPDFERPKRAKFPLIPLFLSSAFLGGVLLGTVFGFYWGKVERIEQVHPSFEEIDEKISHLLQQIQGLCDKITPSIPPEEIIQPLAPIDETASERVA